MRAIHSIGYTSLICGVWLFPIGYGRMDKGVWSEQSRITYNLVDAVARCMVQKIFFLAREDPIPRGHLIDNFLNFLLFFTLRRCILQHGLWSSSCWTTWACGTWGERIGHKGTRPTVLPPRVHANTLLLRWAPRPGQCAPLWPHYQHQRPALLSVLSTMEWSDCTKVIFVAWCLSQTIKD
jgi:hypothetical protein